MNKRNYSKEMDNVITQLESKAPTLLLHSCCAPCSSACLEQLCQFFKVTVFYYNPNITDEDEYNKRVLEQKRFIDAVNKQGGIRKELCKPFNEIQFIEGRYQKEEFFNIAKGYEKCPEGGERCFRCYELRLREAAVVALSGGYDFFTTTLTISPLKNAEKLNEIGEKIALEKGVKFLPSDFKKKNGYKRSIELSKEFELYRQNFCGCVYSKVSG